MIGVNNRIGNNIQKSIGLSLVKGVGDVFNSNPRIVVIRKLFNLEPPKEMIREELRKFLRKKD